MKFFGPGKKTPHTAACWLSWISGLTLRAQLVDSSSWFITLVLNQLREPRLPNPGQTTGSPLLLPRSAASCPPALLSQQPSPLTIQTGPAPAAPAPTTTTGFFSCTFQSALLFNARTVLLWQSRSETERVSGATSAARLLRAFNVVSAAGRRLSAAPSAPICIQWPIHFSTVIYQVYSRKKFLVSGFPP